MASKKGSSMYNIITVNSSVPHFHTVGLMMKKPVRGEVHKEDFSPAACLRVWVTDHSGSGLCL